MKRLFQILLILMPGIIYGQQLPFMDSYSLNPFNFSPAYAGITHGKTLFMDYRSDWTGIEGGPKTCQLSYSDLIRNKVGLGGRFIYDKADIFRQTLLMGTYAYQIKIHRDHTINFALSVGAYSNMIDLSEYYNQPGYSEDMALLYEKQRSVLKVASDVSALYRFRDAELGVYFSNIIFGTVKYRTSDMTYRPFRNYMAHAGYNIEINKKWSVKPVVIFRGGQNIPAQFEISQTTTWNKRLWFTTLFRTSGIAGLGLGGELIDGIYLSYSYDLNYHMTTSVSLSTYGSQQVTLGVRLFKPRKDVVSYIKKR
jgi:type IX secretion system PorP/SprF family membrane protein